MKASDSYALDYTGIPALETEGATYEATTLGQYRFIATRAKSSYRVEIWGGPTQHSGEVGHDRSTGYAYVGATGNSNYISGEVVLDKGDTLWFNSDLYVNNCHMESGRYTNAHGIEWLTSGSGAGGTPVTVRFNGQSGVDSVIAVTGTGSGGCGSSVRAVGAFYGAAGQPAQPLATTDITQPFGQGGSGTCYGDPVGKPGNNGIPAATGGIDYYNPDKWLYYAQDNAVSTQWKIKITVMTEKTTNQQLGDVVDQMKIQTGVQKQIADNIVAKGGEVPVITVVANKPFAVTVGMYDDMLTGTSGGVTAENKVAGDGVVQIKGTITKEGSYTYMISNKKFAIVCISEPSSTNISAILN